MADPRQNLTREALPAKTTHRFGLKSVASTTQVSNGHWMFGSDWEEQCGTNVKVAPNNCDLTLTQEERTKESFVLTEGAGTDDFTLYGFHRCSTVGTLISERGAYAQGELDLGDWHQIERRLAETIVTDGTTAFASGISGARNALAALLMEWGLPIEPTVHMTPNVAIALGSTVQNKANHLELRTGEHLANGFGYADAGTPAVDPEDPDVPVLADATEGFIALTGPVFVTVGQSIQNEQQDVPTNTYLALAERPYSVGYLCKAIYVKVNDVVTVTA